MSFLLAALHEDDIRFGGGSAVVCYGLILRRLVPGEQVLCGEVVLGDLVCDDDRAAEAGDMGCFLICHLVSDASFGAVALIQPD